MYIGLILAAFPLTEKVTERPLMTHPSHGHLVRFTNFALEGAILDSWAVPFKMASGISTQVIYKLVGNIENDTTPTYCIWSRTQRTDTITDLYKRAVP